MPGSDVTRRNFLRTMAGGAAWMGMSGLSYCGGKPLERISENLFLFRDTCNVYIVRRGEEALLVDFGSGRVLDELPRLGVKKIARVLHTHHHRDQCQGDALLERLGVPIVVPEDMRTSFEDPRTEWETIPIYHGYEFKPDLFEPVQPVPVAGTIRPGQGFEWAGLTFDGIANVGHTRRVGLTYAATIDGNRVAFTGDLLHSPGRVWNYHDLQWRYNRQEGVREAVETMRATMALNADCLLPSHGSAMRNAGVALGRTMENLEEVIRVFRWRLWPGDHPLSEGRIFPHVYHDRTSYFIIADNGHCLLYDFGWDGEYADGLLAHLMEEQGLKTIDIVIPSHYHDDHIGAFPYLKQRFPDMQIWAHRCMADVLENPFRYNIPCLGPVGYPAESGIPIDRILDDETFDWEGYRFEMFHFPGQTEYHAGMYAELDGQRMLFMGDSTYRPAPGARFRGEQTNFRNYCRLGEGLGYHRCAQILRQYEPDMAMPAHFGGVPIGPGQIDEYEAWTLEQIRVFQDLIARTDPNFGTDPNWASFYPYRVFVEAGESFSTAVRIRNHGRERATAEVVPNLPHGWRAEPGRRRIRIEAGETGEAVFRIALDENVEIPRRTVLLANLVFDGVDYGTYPHMIADKRSEKSAWARDVFHRYRESLEEVRSHPEKTAYGWPAAWWQPDSDGHGP